MDKAVTAETDNDLALRWQGGATEAYTELVRRHLDPVHHFVRARCGNTQDAADICQDVFLEVCLKISQFNPLHPFTAWLYTIARRKTVDRYRRRRITEAFDPDQHGGTEDRHPSRILEERESAQEAWESVFRLLPEPQATALWLRVQGQQSVSQIACAMDESETNIKVMLFRARQRLARDWQPDSTLTP